MARASAGRVRAAVAQVRGIEERYPRATLFTVALVVYLATANYAMTSMDVAAAEEPAWAFVTTGSFDLSDIRSDQVDDLTINGPAQ